MLKDTPATVTGAALLRRLGFYLFLGLFMLVAPGVLYIDAVVLNQSVDETSVTEILQEIFLFISLLCYLVLYIKSRGKEPFFALVTAFYGVLFIRELDMFLDAIVHGFWKYPAIVVALTGIYIGVKGWQKTRQSLYTFLEIPGGVFTAFGVLLVLFFSRIFGSSKIWEPIMQDRYLYLFKSAIQESIELYGYSIIFIGSVMVFYRLFFKKDI
ncbi:hypothetical protein [Oceanospirillum sp.]|uniref:hypothetical protein n=1 Tax=Oceanospirillum sp. TaxID=2021254 RepID=UPI003A922FFA